MLGKEHNLIKKIIAFYMLIICFSCSNHTRNNNLSNTSNSSIKTAAQKDSITSLEIHFQPSKDI